jgi:hypothetical protein
MPDIVERIAHILGHSRAAGGLSDHDVALNIARELDLVPHDPPQKAEERKFTPSDSPLMQQAERRASTKPDQAATSGGRATKAKEA